MRESALQKQILNYLKAKQYYAIKVITANRSGCPDILACIQGLFVGIEVKVSNNTTSKLQEINLQAIANAKGIALVAYDLQTVKELCESLELRIDN